ncbi:hypothetical protein BVRB_8g189810 [Beta vulgaris subsp. vulgaris]|nr:hypothetical protein BVRB_8g189810 [Beta vulgaris subsp. vulgaris]
MKFGTYIYASLLVPFPGSDICSFLKQQILKIESVT